MSQVPPLRISKGNTPNALPTKGNGTPRHLAELSPMAVRRNSPSFNQATKLLETPQIDSSPFAAKFPTFTASSTRSFWQGRESPLPGANENRDFNEDSKLSSKRPSVENLKRANRVSKSNIFAIEAKREYDPMSAPVVERPLASGRNLASPPMPLGLQARNSLLDRKRPSDEREPDSSDNDRLRRLFDSETSYSAHKSPPPSNASSPTKSAMSQNPRYSLYDPETSVWSEMDDGEEKKLPPGKGLHRHAKSVTFNAKPPEVNEYVQVTPDPSESADSREGSYDVDEEDELYEEDRPRGGSQDSFDESLEDTDKTPVVLPEDWRFMSPEVAHAHAEGLEDPFSTDDANHQLALTNAMMNARSSPARTDSMNSNGSRRPLPPLPPPSFPAERHGSQDSMEAVAERAAVAPHFSPSSPKAAEISKEELRSIGSSANMSLENRLQLMSVRDEDADHSPRKAHEEIRERRMRRKSGLHSGAQEAEIKIFEDQAEAMEQQDEVKEPATSFQPVSRISRESILRKMKSQQFDEYKSPEPESPQRVVLPPLNPDEPIKSYEESPSFLQGDDETFVKQEDEDEVDIYALPLHHQAVDLPKTLDMAGEDDLMSQYSTNTDGERKVSGQLEEETMATPRRKAEEVNDTSMEFEISPPGTPTMGRIPGYSQEELCEPSTPESVIRRSVSMDSLCEDSTEIPEPAATIKAPPGTKMKTRPSLTPQDVRAMAETRRQVSGTRIDVPSIPERHNGRPSAVAEVDSFLETGSQEEESQTQSREKRRSSLVQLEVPVEEEVEELSFGLDKEFDRVIEAQKKGYLMRQNTKVVVASSHANTTAVSDDSAATTQTKALNDMPPPRSTRSAGNSPVKKSPHQPSGAWTTHDWNGKVRRKSIRQSGGLPSELFMSGGVPPLPGMASAVQGMDSLEEADEEDGSIGEGKERGRLFVRVVGLKDLALPLPRSEKSFFALTLDNGLHCVTTSWLELKKEASIGQEFELVVFDDLEFQLTLQTKLEQTKVVNRPESPSKQSPLKKPGFSRFFASPRKKKEQEVREEQERLARQRADQARGPTAWDLLHKHVAQDGSFARSYLSLKEHENAAFGRPLTVEVPCFNEWTVEENRSLAGSRGGKSSSTVNTSQRKAPYKVGKLEVQLLYVPKPKDAKEEEMPKSMNACVRELQEAERSSNQTHEGFLSQQGGDCPFWRRRFFRLAGTKLTAYHEATRQPRATINLGKASKLIDDKTNLKQQASSRNGGRRKSAFGSEEEGYMFLEEGFRVRFANGETIDFYAENVTQKDEWMAVLANVVGRSSKPGRSWTDVVLRRDKAMSQMQANQNLGRKSSKESRTQPAAPELSRNGIPEKRPASQDGLISSSSSALSGSRPSSARSGDSAGGSAVITRKEVPTGRRQLVSAAERRAKARSTYY